MAEKPFWEKNDVIEKYQKSSREFIYKDHPYPGNFSGRGVVCCAGGVTYLTGAWVMISMLRRVGCKLPVQIWHFGEREAPEKIQELFDPLDNIDFVNIEEVAKVHPMNNLRGWESKIFAIIHCTFKEVLLIDGDNIPIVDPTYLFDLKEYTDIGYGAMFWPDFGRLQPGRSIWKVAEVPYQDEPEFESGQILVDKEKCWKALLLSRWYNERSDFYYKHVHGDKETYHLAFRRLNQPYYMCPKMVGIPDSMGHQTTMCQHDPSGKRIFQHRNMAKFQLYNRNRHVPDFKFESECLEYLDKFRRLLSGYSTYNLSIESPIKSNPFTYFDKTYLINLDNRDDRLSEVKQRLDKLNITFERFPAFRPDSKNGFGTIGQHGAALSHLGVWRKALNEKLKNVLILEDDVLFRDDVMNWMQFVIKQLDMVKWDMCYLGTKLESQTTMVTPNLYKFSRGLHFHAYVVNHTIYQHLINSVEKMVNNGPKNHVDIFVTQLPNIVRLCCMPCMAVQVTNYSDISEQEMSRLDEYFNNFDDGGFIMNSSELWESLHGIKILKNLSWQRLQESQKQGKQ